VIVASVPIDALTGVVSAMLVAFFWLARQFARLSERVARLEGRLNGRD
jgi:MFS superfamily sulfate permease-like transporter